MEVQVTDDPPGGSGGEDVSPVQQEEVQIVPLILSDPEVEPRHQIKYGRPLQAMWGLFSEYANNSSIHGVRYVGEKRRPWIERLWWVIALGLSIYGCSTLIYNVWKKWDQSPFIVSFVEKPIPVWEIPFPAVTVCPETKFNSKLLNFEKEHKNLVSLVKSTRKKFNASDDEKFLNFLVVLQTCKISGLNVGDADLGDVFSVDRLKRVSPNLNKTVQEAHFIKKVIDRQQYFSPIVTEAGICFSFNTLSAQDMFRQENIDPEFNRYYVEHNLTSEHWTMESGYSPYVSLSTYPQRVPSAGFPNKLTVDLFLDNEDFSRLCRKAVSGFKVLLHSPGEIPRIGKSYFQVPINQNVMVAVKPTMTTTSQGLRNYSPEKRQCFFSDERYLHFFKVYTQQNCELECLSNYTMLRCGCAKYSMPRGPYTRVCNTNDIKCYYRAENSFQKDIVMAEIDIKEFTKRNGTKCNCLPSCTSITYDLEKSEASFTMGRKAKMETLSELSISFKEDHFFAFQRAELYGPTDFIANCGGLLGLFMGVSILSIVEVVYYLTIRLICNLYMRKKRKLTIKRTNPSVSLLSSASMGNVVEAVNNPNTVKKGRTLGLSDSRTNGLNLVDPETIDLYWNHNGGSGIRHRSDQSLYDRCVQENYKMLRDNQWQY